jgi:hypothetical protein
MFDDLNFLSFMCQAPEMGCHTVYKYKKHISPCMREVQEIHILPSTRKVQK